MLTKTNELGCMFKNTGLVDFLGSQRVRLKLVAYKKFSNSFDKVMHYTVSGHEKITGIRETSISGYVLGHNELNFI